MFAIVEIAGQQFKVEKGQKLFVHRLKADEGASVVFGIRWRARTYGLRVSAPLECNLAHHVKLTR
jgi:ribosomal protein L21